MSVRTKNKHGRTGARKPGTVMLSQAEAKRRRLRRYVDRHAQASPLVSSKKGSGKATESAKLAEKMKGSALLPAHLFEATLSTKEAAEVIGRGVTYVKDHAEDLGGEKHGLRWKFNRTVLLARHRDIG